MGIGGPIALIVIGLIIALATNLQVGGIDLQLIGWILTAAGAVWLILVMSVLAPRRRRTTVTDRALVDRGDGYAEPVVRERTIDDGPV